MATRRANGFSVLELVIVVCVIAVLGTVVAQRLTTLRAEAERAAMDALLGALRSSLGMRVASHLAKGQYADIAKLAGSNPIDLLAETPDNYRGAFFGIDPALIEDGNWYFDTRDRALVYRVRFSDYFRGSPPGSTRARFTIVAVFDSAGGDPGSPGDVKRVAGMRLKGLDSYSWAIQ